MNLYHVIRNCIIDGIEKRDGDTIDERDIPDDEWEAVRQLGCLYPNIPYRHIAPPEPVIDEPELIVSDEVEEITDEADDE